MTCRVAYKNLPLPRVELLRERTEQDGKFYWHTKVVARNPSGDSMVIFEKVSRGSQEEGAEVMAKWCEFLGWPFFSIRVSPRTTKSYKVEEGLVQ